MGLARVITTAEAADIEGTAVVIDVLRAFTTAAYAFAGGASRIIVVATVEEALAWKAADPTILAVGESYGHRPAGFDFSNSPATIAAADIRGRTLVKRTTAGTQGVIATQRATRSWCASLVIASATAAAVQAAHLGRPTYVATGRFAGGGARSGSDDVATAELIERARLRRPLDIERAVHEVSTSEEAMLTLATARPARHRRTSSWPSASMRSILRWRSSGPRTVPISSARPSRPRLMPFLPDTTDRRPRPKCGAVGTDSGPACDHRERGASDTRGRWRSQRDQNVAEDDSPSYPAKMRERAPESAARVPGERRAVAPAR